MVEDTDGDGTVQCPAAGLGTAERLQRYRQRVREKLVERDLAGDALEREVERLMTHDIGFRFDLRDLMADLAGPASDQPDGGQEDAGGERGDSA